MSDPCIEIVQNGQWWLSPLAIFVSACIGAGVAICAIINQHAIARRRATLDMIVASEGDGPFQRNLAVFKSESKCSRSLRRIARSESASELATQRQVDSFLNHYELIAIAIEKKILDKEFYKLWMRGAYVEDYIKAAPYINELQGMPAGDQTFINFQRLAREWMNDKEKLAAAEAEKAE